ncbi:mycofactocin-coupled SDR family oxidoreductase [Mycolicibacterium stellerae]|uniref:mycofactocin-coupled SDR family oxidoreductase n=1 Tax=Mycolicibacterium stellerae TaxID=2358193 RepID=UPI000F0BC6B8|nr:mycofactocin-coupled SDR family oxidoreductase [Mycolicibacterium stellerae]
MARVAGKVAFITGVARGQGRAHAVRLAAEGADIIGVDSLEPDASAPYPMATPEQLDDTVAAVERTGRRILATKADVRDRDALLDAVKSGIDRFGRLDILIANAGIVTTGRPTWEVPQQDWDAVIATNLTGVVNSVAAAVPAMLQAGNGGSIILTSSGAGMRHVGNLAPYNASKAGVIAVGKTLANELAPHAIRVNVLAPGTVGTEMVTKNDELFRLFRPDLESPTLEDAIPVFSAMMPMGRPWLDAEDMADAVLFLASDDAKYITGQVLAVDQGVTNRP